MRFLNIFFPFKKQRSFLNEKLWHRFSIVSFAVCVVLCFFFNCYWLNNIMPERPFLNVSIKYNLKDYTKSSSSEIINTIASFTDGYRVGCLTKTKVKPIPSYVMNKTVCNSDIPSKIRSVARTFIKSNPSIIKANEDQVVSDMEKMIAEDKETRYCFINQGANCTSDKIVAYERNIIFYLEVFFASFGLTYLFALIIHVMYFNGLIFILYGADIEK